jgi:hypothetical protein
MTAYNVISPGSLQAGQPEDISVILSNLQAIQGVLNGGIDNGNINAAAAIAASKLAGYPSDLLKVLRGDGSWAAIPPVVTGDELAYAERTTDLVTTATASVGTAILAAPAITCDGVTPVIVEYFSPSVQHSIANSLAILEMNDGTNQYGIIARVNSGPVGLGTFIYARRRIIPTAGTKTFAVSGWSLTAGNLTWGGSTGGGAASNVPMWIRVSRVSPIPPSVAPGSFTAVYYGTSFPASPTDGQEAILVDSVTAPSYHWRFRYNAGNSTAWKWEFIGGAPWVVNVPTMESTLSGSYVDLTTPQTFTAPRAGVFVARLSYSQEYGATANGNGAGAQLLWNGAQVMEVLTLQNTGATASQSGYGTYRGTLAASQLIAAKWRAINGQANYLGRTLEVIPVRMA